MRIVVTRPQPDAERTAAALRQRGHEVLIAPVMGIEPVAADLSGEWSAIAITSANAPLAIAGNPAHASLLALPLFAVGDRSAQAAREAGFANVISASGDAHDLVRLIVRQKAGGNAPLLYLAGEEQAADLIGDLAAQDINAQMRIIYRALAAPFPEELIEAIKASEIDAVLHYSRRSAENYLTSAEAAGVASAAIRPRHLCLSPKVAAPLAAAGASSVAIAENPDESSLLALLDAMPG